MSLSSLLQGQSTTQNNSSSNSNNSETGVLISQRTPSSSPSFFSIDNLYPGSLGSNPQQIFDFTTNPQQLLHSARNRSNSSSTTLNKSGMNTGSTMKDTTLKDAYGLNPDHYIFMTSTYCPPDKRRRSPVHTPERDLHATFKCKKSNCNNERCDKCHVENGELAYHPFFYKRADREKCNERKHYKPNVSPLEILRCPLVHGKELVLTVEMRNKAMERAEIEYLKKMGTKTIDKIHYLTPLTIHELEAALSKLSDGTIGNQFSSENGNIPTTISTGSSSGNNSNNSNNHHHQQQQQHHHHHNGNNNNSSIIGNKKRSNGSVGSNKSPGKNPSGNNSLDSLHANSQPIAINYSVSPNSQKSYAATVAQKASPRGSLLVQSPPNTSTSLPSHIGNSGYNNHFITSFNGGASALSPPLSSTPPTFMPHSLSSTPPISNHLSLSQTPPASTPIPIGHPHMMHNHHHHHHVGHHNHHMPQQQPIGSPILSSLSLSALSSSPSGSHHISSSLPQDILSFCKSVTKNDAKAQQITCYFVDQGATCMDDLKHFKDENSWDGFSFGLVYREKLQEAIRFRVASAAQINVIPNYRIIAFPPLVKEKLQSLTSICPSLNVHFIDKLLQEELREKILLKHPIFWSEQEMMNFLDLVAKIVSDKSNNVSTQNLEDNIMDIIQIKNMYEVISKDFKGHHTSSNMPLSMSTPTLSNILLAYKHIRDHCHDWTGLGKTCPTCNREPCKESAYFQSLLSSPVSEKASEWKENVFRYFTGTLNHEGAKKFSELLPDLWFGIYKEWMLKEKSVKDTVRKQLSKYY